MADFESDTTAAALASLSSDAGTDSGAPEPAPAPVENKAPEQVAPEATPVEGTTPTETPDFDLGVDPSKLTGDNAVLYRSMQEGARKKFQEAADLRKPYEDLSKYGDPQTLAQLAEFAHQMTTSEEFARNIYNTLHESWGAQPEVTDPALTDDEGVDYSDLSPALIEKLNRIDAFEKNLAERDRTEVDRNFAIQTERELIAEENGIRAANPQYTDRHINYINELAFAHGGSLIKAEAAMRTQRDFFLTEYIQSKASIPAAVTAPTAGVLGEVPATPTTGMSDKQVMRNASDMAERFLAEQQAASI